MKALKYKSDFMWKHKPAEIRRWIYRVSQPRYDPNQCTHTCVSDTAEADVFATF